MPVAVSGEKVTATFDDGVLAVTLPVPIANCAMEVEGDDLDDPFAIAAAAVAELMVDGHRPAHRRAPCPVQRARTASRSGVAEEAWHRLQRFGHQDING